LGKKTPVAGQVGRQRSAGSKLRQLATRFIGFVGAVADDHHAATLDQHPARRLEAHAACAAHDQQLATLEALTHFQTPSFGCGRFMPRKSIDETGLSWRRPARVKRNVLERGTPDKRDKVRRP
jgi:hypothetical protein